MPLTVNFPYSFYLHLQLECFEVNTKRVSYHGRLKRNATPSATDFPITRSFDSALASLSVGYRRSQALGQRRDIAFGTDGLVELFTGRP